MHHSRRCVCHCSRAGLHWTVLILLVPFSDARAQHSPDREEHGSPGAGVAAAGGVQSAGLPLLALDHARCRLRHVHGYVLAHPVWHVHGYVLSCPVLSFQSARVLLRSVLGRAPWDFNCVLWGCLLLSVTFCRNFGTTTGMRRIVDFAVRPDIRRGA